MFHSKLKETLNHSIAKVTSDRDSFVSHPEKDFCVSENSLRSRLFCPLVLKVNPLPSVNSWTFFQMSADAPSISVLNQRCSQKLWKPY